VFLSEQQNVLRYEKLQQVFEVLSFGLGAHSRKPLVCRSVNNMFEFSPEINGSCVSSRYCWYGNHAAGSKPIKKNYHSQLSTVCGKNG